MNKPKIVAFIFARGGSKGLPGKNVKLFKGKPLISHSISYAIEHPSISDVILSTDCPEIAEVGREYGAKVPFMRPKELATDLAPENEAWKHAVSFYRENIGSFDLFLSLPAVSPLREEKDLERAIEVYNKTRPDFVISAFKSDCNPYFNLLERKGEFMEISKSQAGLYRRQDASEVFKILPMYYLCSADAPFKVSSVLGGKVSVVEIPSSRAVDIDTQEDFNYLEFLEEKHKIRTKENS